MFHDLDETLKAMLDDAAAPTELRAADVSFDTPDKDYKPTEATVNLFLHEVTENRSLRDEARVLARAGDVYTSRLPSLRVDCTYLATAWSSQAGGLRAAEEHRLLGLALQWLSRFPVVDERFLRGSLKTPPQPYPLPAVVAQTQEGRSIGEFWSALGVSPRPAFPLTVTVALEPYDEVEELPLVQEVHLRSTLVDHPVLRGVLFDKSLAPVPAAAVSVVETGAQATSGPDGEFVVPGLEFGTYTLTVRASGRPDEQVAVTFAADHQTQTVVLSGP
ncbi:Pvc16 family protein [Kribbella sp. NPDC049174]|uniref:Pvc16 family protein n=1 Tax=Kribbella sp. NPDC049174 TaxID=3364112 RepID=UPI003710723B